MNLATLTASDLQIAGLTPMSSVDWPGKFVATVFAQGCPWACPYCHNQAIIDPKIPGVVSWESVEELLGRRRGLLDGVVFSGGEATRQLAVLPAMQRVRELGFEIAYGGSLSRASARDPTHRPCGLGRYRHQGDVRSQLRGRGWAPKCGAESVGELG